MIKAHNPENLLTGNTVIDGIHVENNCPFPKAGEVFELGVPFPINVFFLEQKINLRRGRSQSDVSFSYKVTALWPDGSIKWALLVFRLDLAPSERVELSICKEGLETVVKSTRFHNLLSTDRTGASISVNSPSARFVLNLEAFSPFEKVSINDNTAAISNSKLSLNLEHFGECEAVVTSLHEETDVITVGAECKKITFNGEFRRKSTFTGLTFISTVQIFSGSALIKWEFTICNPNPATHPGGCWDLGDDGSIGIRALSVNFPTQEESMMCLKERLDVGWEETASDFNLLQSGSGCRDRAVNSAIGSADINETGGVHAPFNGYRVHRKDKIQTEGPRASPQLWVQGENFHLNKGVAICLKNFWQNFPKAIDYRGDLLRVDLFPLQGDGGVYELQGGERKTHSMYFDFSASKGGLDWVISPSSCRISPSWYERCQVFPFMTEKVENDLLAPFIEQGIIGDHSFENKRELINEYGWRNFGDIYADHESLYQQVGETPFISHYNNQYDAIYGYARQFIQTGDFRWFKLMDELAKHVTDIDIYHTEQDRVEYNNGLFWHTDHYLDAQTCTHRTFSKLNNTSSTPGQTGGGPGPEHCYTTGLLYHYYLTGNESSKTAVLEMAGWIINSHHGAKTFLGQILSIKKNELSKVIEKVKGGNPLSYRYPFTRGTGNSIVALLDAYTLSGEKEYLNRVEDVIKKSIHPSDEIVLRNLSDIEATWSYVVLLQSLGKYLFIKEQLDELDDAFSYGRAALLHYAEWMLANESPYLSKIEVLEFPNDTWVAQEIRKVSVFISAAYYDPILRAQYRTRANEFLIYIVDRLSKSKERHYSRIQILLLQSYGPHLWCNDQRLFCDSPVKLPAQDFGAPPRLTISILIVDIVKKFLLGVKYFSIEGERSWLKSRT